MAAGKLWVFAIKRDLVAFINVEAGIQVEPRVHGVAPEPRVAAAVDLVWIAIAIEIRDLLAEARGVSAMPDDADARPASRLVAASLIVTGAKVLGKVRRCLVALVGV